MAELADVVRRALQNVRFTAEAHLKAVQEAEDAFAEYERVIADQFEDARVNGGGQGFPAEEPSVDGPPLADVGGGFEEGAASGRSGSRRRSRSRSRRSHHRRRGGDEEAVRAACTRLGLDDNASRHIQQFPPQEALRMLEQVRDDVRNPSAFVMKMCTRSEGGAPAGGGHGHGSVEDAIQALSLDDSASRVLREMNPDQALNIIEQVDDKVRNPSAFIMSIATRQKGSGKGTGANSVRAGGSSRASAEIEDRCRHLRLDDSAARMLSELPTERALDILDQIGDDVRNPSAFVTAEARKLLPGGGGGGGRSKSGGGGGAPVPAELARQIDHFASQLDLDPTCSDALHQIGPQDAVQILERLASDLTSIRNRSAFVIAEVKKRKSGGGGGPPRSSERASERASSRGPASQVPCKFWAENRCKNGTDCRFSHS